MVWWTLCLISLPDIASRMIRRVSLRFYVKLVFHWANLFAQSGFSFVSIAFSADKGKSRSAQTNSASGKPALKCLHYATKVHTNFHGPHSPKRNFTPTVSFLRYLTMFDMQTILTITPMAAILDGPTINLIWCCGHV
jgi:hypothetical protein